MYMYMYVYVYMYMYRLTQVICFSTAMNADRETSFDHPNIPSVVNPFNLKNRIGPRTVKLCRIHIPSVVNPFNLKNRIGPH